ncbi:hypothetical protein HanXRQr2_Chr04g0168421 [Helianthus annuus]|uniref:Uncharacterized protein n=1 Tax=Helianthus annuus TaxID=4232 RepID=A0A251UYD4_HELAN|nr:hypothetical protein HanXRQr2_Chr04g0168421 [Helianthus annuus]KAJ0589044.1 hypothetical protein HanIR_Chr04g0181611 [Helianthus annuus]KAJ0931466.1 hypothetical protein HanPSC8_Chr04g0161961 [Helianthus annuus]
MVPRRIHERKESMKLRFASINLFNQIASDQFEKKRSGKSYIIKTKKRRLRSV